MVLNIKSTPATASAAKIIGVLYLVYGIFMLGLSGLLFSFAIGLIVMGIIGSFELSVAATILVGLFFHYYNYRRRADGFQTWDPMEVVDRLAKQRSINKLNTPPVGYDGKYAPSEAMGHKTAGPRQNSVLAWSAPACRGCPQGVLASEFAEGFADAKSDTDASGSTTNSSESTTGAASSKPAPAVAPPAPATGAATTKSGFQGAPSDGLFKLGEMPSESAGGPHIDVGSTILSAIKNLKPDQLTNMTEDTRKLLDTQKSLLGMLETMKPMLADGSQLLNSFNSMFGSGAMPAKLGV